MSIGELKTKITADASGFKQSMDLVKRKIQESSNEFKVAASAARVFGSAEDELRAKQKYLTEQIQLQDEKVRILEEAFRKSVQEKGKDATATQKLADQLATARTGLNKLHGELRDTNGALDKNKNNVKGTERAWEQLKGAVGRVSAAMGKGAKSIASATLGIGKAAAIGIAGLGAAVAGIGAGIGKLVVDTANAGQKFVDMSAETGIGVERLQELAYAGEIVGTDLEIMTRALAKMTRTMATSPKAFEALGVAATNADGSLRDSEQVFYDAIDALAQVENETQRDALAMDIFGKSAMELNPLIKAGADELERLSKEARAVGAVMSEEDAQAAADFRDQLDSLKMGLQGTALQIGSAFLPGLSAIASVGGGYLKRFASIVKESDGDIGKMGSGISGLAGEIVKDIAKQAPTLMKAGLGILQGIVSAIIENLPSLLTMAIQIVTLLAGFLIESAPRLMEAAVKILLTLINTLVTNLPMLAEAAVQMILALATGIGGALPELTPAIVGAILMIVQVLLENLPMIIEAALILFGGLALGLINAIPALVNAVPEIVKAVQKAFRDNGPRLLQVGKDIVGGIWQGIQSMKDKFSEDVKKFFKGIVDSVKNALGIHSDARIMMPLGKYTVGGFVTGIKRATDQMKAETAASMRGLALSAGTAGYGALQENYTFYAPVMIGGQTGQRVGQAIRARRW